MEKQKKMPILRFSEFKDEWEMKKLGEVAKFSKGKGISKADIIVDGKIECIRYGELYTLYGETIDVIKSRTNIPTNNLVFSEANDVIIPASGESQIDIATASCVLKSGIALGGDLNIIKTNKNGVYLSYYLNSSKKKDIANLAQGISVVHLYSSQLALLNLSFPSLPEQTKIASFLTSVDKKLSQLKQKKNLLEQYKKGVMQKLFSQELRFKYENGKEFPDWEKNKLGVVLIKNSNKNKGQKYSLVQSVSNKHGFINQDEMFEDRRVASKDTSNYYVIEKGHFAYNPSRIDVGSLAYKFDDITSTISPLYISFRAKSDFLTDEYLLNWFRTEQFIKQMNSSFEGSVRNTLSYESLVKMKISIPSLTEQTKIAHFLSAIDEKINRTQNQITQTENWKKGLLQQMFC
jgi:type I restriction enzyme S subunit